MSLLIKNATIVTMNPDREVIHGNIYIEQDRLVEIGETRETAEEIIDASGRVVIPGLIQPHIHLCQTLFRGQADDLELLDWLRLRIWPLEGAHDEESIRTSALLGLGELIKGGTTAIVDMETVHHTDAAIQAITESGIRALTGKAMMDYGDDVPDTLKETTDSSLKESVELLEKWHGYNDGLVQYVFAPRFVVSCTEELLKEVGHLAKQYGVKIHTHASENKGECELVMQRHGMRNVIYLEHIGLTGPDLILAHCIWLDDREMKIITESGTKVVYCPSSNTKLASGIARIPEMLEKKGNVSIAADGAPCNNNLDGWLEMRLAALLQKPQHGPTVMPAEKVFELATIGGARAMGLEDEIGSIEVGKKADLAIVDLNRLHALPASNTNIYSRLVYEARADDVRTTIVNGRVLMRDRELLTIDEEEVKRQAEQDIIRVARRAGLIA
jgi:cytosine/adenosine deaminase-related metal-dependent hydrolase